MIKRRNPNLLGDQDPTFDYDPPRRLIVDPHTIRGDVTTTAMVSRRCKENNTRTAGQEMRRTRDLVIALAARHGASQRQLALAFDLPRSRVAVIIQNIEKEKPVDDES